MTLSKGPPSEPEHWPHKREKQQQQQKHKHTQTSVTYKVHLQLATVLTGDILAVCTRNDAYSIAI